MKKKLNFEFAGLKSDVYTFGNYQYSNKKLNALPLNHIRKYLKKFCSYWRS